MIWLLKCYYGYRNRWDELLMMGVIDYLFDHYDLTHLDVEVGDREWITRRCELNNDRRQQHSHRVSFVITRKFSMWTAHYDMIFAGGGEVLAAHTRDFWRAWVNYLALFRRWIWSGRVVRLGGIETPTARYSKILYRMMLPFAHQIVCRERTSYDLALQYTDKAVLYHDWAIDVIVQNKDKGQGMKYPREVINGYQKNENLELNVGSMAWLDRSLNNDLLNNKVPYFTTTDDKLQVRSDKHTVLRKMVWMIVKHPTDNSYLMMQRSDSWNYTNPAWWIEEWDNLIDTVIKELLEETWYDDIARIIDLTHQIHFHQFAPHKDENRYGITNLFEVQLASLSQQDIDPKELTQHQAVWIAKDKMGNISDLPLIQYIWDYYCAVKEDRVFPTPMDRIEADNKFTATMWKNEKMQQYIIINFIPKHTDVKLIQEFNKRILNYPDHQIINFPAEEWDLLPVEIIQKYSDRIITRHWSEHEASQTLRLFSWASWAFVHRLHCVIPCLHYNIPLHTTAYSEKVNKIIAMMSLKQPRIPV